MNVRCATLTTVASRIAITEAKNADTGDAQQAGVESVRIVRQVAGGLFDVRGRRRRARNHDLHPNEKLAS